MSRSVRLRSVGGVLAVVALAAGCGSEASRSDASADAHCSLAVEVGTGDRSSFVPLADGDSVELVLGFQGFRMLDLALRVVGAPDTYADLTAHLEVNGSGVVLDQSGWQVPMDQAPDGAQVVEGYLLYFNDAPASQVVGHSATLDELVQVGSCTGVIHLTLELRDDDACVDTMIPDASLADGGLPDGAVPCGATP